MKLIVGQKVYLKPINNWARYSKEIKEDEIASVGRKYATLKDRNNSKFELESMHEFSNYSPDYQVFLSREEAEGSLKRPQLLRDVEKRLSFLDYHQLLELNKFIDGRIKDK